jgi:hypothetical protein
MRPTAWLHKAWRTYLDPDLDIELGEDPEKPTKNAQEVRWAWHKFQNAILLGTDILYALWQGLTEADRDDPQKGKLVTGTIKLARIVATTPLSDADKHDCYDRATRFRDACRYRSYNASCELMEMVMRYCAGAGTSDIANNRLDNLFRYARNTLGDAVVAKAEMSTRYQDLCDGLHDGRVLSHDVKAAFEAAFMAREHNVARGIVADPPKEYLYRG